MEVTFSLDCTAQIVGEGSEDQKRATMNYLSDRHPVPEFEDVRLYDECTVDAISGRLATEDSTDTRVVEHQYFKGLRPGKGSVTALGFFTGFDGDAQSSRIAVEENRMLCDDGYKYFQAARSDVIANWAELVENCEAEELSAPERAQLIEVGAKKLYRYAQLGKKEELVARFRLVRDPVAKQYLQDFWSNIGQVASAEGTKMHLAIEQYYNKCLPEGADKTVEMQQFARFRKEWVDKRRLRILRTELSMHDPYAQVFGTIDAVYVHRDADLHEYPLDVVLVDWKRTQKNDDKAYRRKDEPLGVEHMGKPPFDDWENCTQTKRWMQLMVYAKILQDNTGGRYRVTGMYNVLFHEKADDYIVAEVPPFDDQRIQEAFDIARSMKANDLVEQRRRLTLLAHSMAQCVHSNPEDTASVSKLLSATTALVDTEAAAQAMRDAAGPSTNKRRRQSE